MEALIVYGAFALFVWFSIGVFVIDYIDVNYTLHDWAFNSPVSFCYELLVLVWPLVLWYWWQENTKQRSGGKK